MISDIRDCFLASLHAMHRQGYGLFSDSPLKIELLSEYCRCNIFQLQKMLKGE
jgi:hypothetical protein